MTSQQNGKNEPEVVPFGQAELLRFGDLWLPRFLSGTEERVQTIRDCQVGDNDVLVASYPKSGTAWMLRVANLIKFNADVTEADRKRLDEQGMMIEHTGVDQALSNPEPRVIKTHFDYKNIPVTFRQGKGKIIYICRNAKDVLVSFYHFTQGEPNLRFSGSFEGFFEKFMQGLVPYGLWGRHIKEYWEHRNDANLLFVQFEDLKKNPKKGIKEIVEFLGKDFTEDQINTIVDESSFDKMKKNKMTNYQWAMSADKDAQPYMRKGTVGDWRNVFTPEMSRRVDEMVNSEFADSGLTFTFE